MKVIGFAAVFASLCPPVMAKLDAVKQIKSSTATAMKNAVDSRNGRNPANGFEEIDVYVDLGIQPSEITDDELDFMTEALKFTFDTTSENGKYHSDFAYLNKIERERTEINGNLRQTRSYHLSYWLKYGCPLCPHDDDSFMTEEGGVTWKHKDEKAWADAWCSALRNSDFDGLKNARDCIIQLPEDGVHAAAHETVASKVSSLPSTDVIVKEEVDRRNGRDPANGFEEVDIYVDLGIDLSEITDDELDFMTAALVLTFDESSENGKYHSDYAYLNKIERERREINGNLRQTRSYHLSYWLKYGCPLCPHDDDSFMTEEGGVAWKHKDEKAWADAWCSALRNSDFDGLKNARDCIIQLPEDGVHAAAHETVASKVSSLPSTDVIVKEEVDRRKGRNPANGFEEVDIYVDLGIDLSEITDEEVDFMTAALVLTFDETSENGKFHSDFAYLNKIERERREINGNLRQTRSYHLSYWLKYGCPLCPHDDDSFMTEEGGVTWKHKDEKAWADAWCSALRNSDFDGLKNARDCIIQLPEDGVHAAANKFNEDEEKTMLSTVQRFLFG
ncbi:hypothetical protein ACA910_019635 [Epithemia clementina (nom. ined.)]